MTDKNAAFRFRVSTNLRFGAGESGQLGPEMKDLGFSRAAAVVDAAVASHAVVRAALQSVRDSGIGLDVYETSEAEPTYEYLEAFRSRFAGKSYDSLVAVGGGSAMDLAKGIAVLLVNEGPALSFRGFPKLKNRPLPLVAIPTTAGTGSEVTYNAVFTDGAQKKKLGINSMLNFPVCAILDPLLTVGCPKPVTVSSGADALVHTLESFVHRNHTPLSRMHSIEAFKLVFPNLGKVLDQPQDLGVRGGLALGAYHAALALFNSGSGPSGALSYPLGAVYKVPHGYAGAVFLSSITRLNVEKGYEDFVLLYDQMEGADKSLPVREKNRHFSHAIQGLMDKLGVPKSLSHYGLGPKDIDFMIGQYEPLKAAIAQNPMEMTQSDIETIIRSLS